VITGAFVWFGFVATATAFDYAWQRGLLIELAILGAVGV